MWPQSDAGPDATAGGEARSTLYIDLQHRKAYVQLPLEVSVESYWRASVYPTQNRLALAP